MFDTILCSKPNIVEINENVQINGDLCVTGQIKGVTGATLNNKRDSINLSFVNGLDPYICIQTGNTGDNDSWEPIGYFCFGGTDCVGNPDDISLLLRLDSSSVTNNNFAFYRVVDQEEGPTGPNVYAQDGIVLQPNKKFVKGQFTDRPIPFPEDSTILCIEVLAPGFKINVAGFKMTYLD